MTLPNSTLADLVKRCIRLEDEKAALAEDIKTVKEEAKSQGYNLRSLNAAIRVTRMDAKKREQYDGDQADLELYLENLKESGDV